MKILAVTLTIFIQKTFSRTTSGNPGPRLSVRPVFPRVNRDLDSRATEGFLFAAHRGFDLLADAADFAFGSAAPERSSSCSATHLSQTGRAC